MLSLSPSLSFYFILFFNKILGIRRNEGISWAERADPTGSLVGHSSVSFFPSFFLFFFLVTNAYLRIHY